MFIRLRPEIYNVKLPVDKTVSTLHVEPLDCPIYFVRFRLKTMNDMKKEIKMKITLHTK